MRLFLILIFFLMISGLYAQDSYKIDFKIKGLKDTTAYLGYFMEEKTFVRDTATVNSKGEFTFQGNKALPHGIYFLVLAKSRIMDFVVGLTQHFSLQTSTDDYVKNMVVKGDDDNRLFFENMRYSAERNAEAEPFRKTVNDSTLTKEQKSAAIESLNKINDKVMAHHQGIIDKYPATVTARLMKMHKTIPIPDPPKKPDGTIDSTFQLRYYRAHYFDNFDLGDELMLRQQKVFYWEKVKDYLSKLYVQHPDTITKVIDGLVAIAKKNKDTYRYLVWNCLLYYQTHEIMGMDEVYVNISDKYFVSGEMDFWLDKKTIQNIKKLADDIRLAMIGRTGPNLVMQDENGQKRSLYDLNNKYTIVVFFWPKCATCRAEAPKLVDFYNTRKSKYKFEVFAVATDTSLQDMKDFIREFKTPWITVSGPRTYLPKHHAELYYVPSTPTIYILDDKKKVIARKLGVEQLDMFLENYERLQRKVPAPN